MKRTAISGLIFAVALGASFTLIGEDRKASVLLQEGKNRETLDGDLKGAIALYEEAANEAGSNRVLKAQALLRLGIAYKHRDDAKALAVFDRVSSEFSDQKDVAEEARRRLNAMGGSRPATSVSASYTDAPELVDRLLWQGETTDTSGRVSSDGRYLSFVDRSEGGGLAVRDLVAGKNRILLKAGNGVVGSSAISRDGKRVAYAWRPNAGINGELRVVGTDDLKERLVYSNTGLDYLQPMDWTSDGSILALLSTKHGGSQIAIIDIAGNIKQKLTMFAGPGIPGNLSLSPDGRFVAYDLPQNDNSKARDVFVVDTNGGFLEFGVAHDAANDGVLGWADSKRLLIASDRGGSTGIWAIETVNGKPVGSPLLVRENFGAIHSLGMTSSSSLIYSSGSKEIRVMQNLLPELARLQVAAAQSPQPQSLATALIEGVVVMLGTNEPISGVDVELTRLEGTVSSPLSPGAAEAFKTLYANGKGSATALTPPPALAPEIVYAKTGDDGKFAFRNLKAGGYRLVSAGGLYYPAELGQRDPMGRGQTFPLADGAAMRNVRLEMSPLGSIAGRIVDSDSEPMGHVDVFAMTVSYEGGRRKLLNLIWTLTDSRGQYRLVNLPVGTYYISARINERVGLAKVSTPPGRSYGFEIAGLPVVTHQIQPDGTINEQTYRIVYFGGVSDAQSARPIALRPGEDFAGADISMDSAKTESHHIRGVLLNGITNQPFAGVNISAVPRQSGPITIYASGTSDANGTFDISGIAPGSYTLVSAFSRVPSAQPAGPNTGGPPAAISVYTVVDVGNSDIEKLRIVASPPVNLSGKVTIENHPGEQNTLDTAKIRIAVTREPDILSLPPGMSPALPNNGAVAVDGGFTLQVAPGDYRLTLSGIPSAAYVKSIRMGVIDVQSNGLHVEGASANPIQIVIASDVGELDGVAVNNKLDSMTNVVVALVPDSPARRQTPDFYIATTSDADGKFHLRNVPTGDYKLFAWEYAGQGIWQDPQFLKDYEALGKPIRIAAGSREQTQISVVPIQK